MSSCPFCQQENTSGVDRCAHCGAALTTIADSRHADLDPESAAGPASPLDERIRELLAEGRKIEAVNVYREATGVGLAEAKASVEAIEGGTRRASTLVGVNAEESHQELERLLRDAGLIAAIKYYREQTGRGLKESKDAVEAFARERGIQIKKGAGCGASAAAILVLACAISACVIIAG
jgi:ribosomal protein L7/L12